MTENIKTLELAKLYEQQGYYKDALDIYMYLAKKNPDLEQKSGLEKKIEQLGQKTKDTENQEWEKLSDLCEQWIKLMILKLRLDNYKRIGS